MTMLMVNVAEFKTHCSEYLKRAQKGEEIEICIHNVPVAKLEPIAPPKKNRTKLGWGKGTIVFSPAYDPFAPATPLKHWKMLKDKPDDTLFS